LEPAKIDRLIAEGEILSALEQLEDRSQALYEIDDTIFTDQKLQHMIRPLSDPAKPLLPSFYSLNPGEIRPMKNPKKNILLLGAIGLILLVAVTTFVAYADWIRPEEIRNFLEISRGTLWALP